MTKTRLLSLGLSVVLFVAALVLATGTGYARYTTHIIGAPSYKATLSAQPYLLQTDSDGNAVAYEGKWQKSGGEQFVSLLIRNTQDVAPTQDITVRVRIFVPDSIKASGVSPGNLVFTVQQGTSALVLSTVDYLSTQTPLYAQRGENGWIYSFYRTVKVNNVSTRQEVTYTLPGKAVHQAELRLTVRNVVVDCTAFTIYVDRI